MASLPSSGLISPCQPLPPPPRLRTQFVGREEELARLAQILISPCATTKTEPPLRASLVGLRGIGGIGKTTIAMEFAERYANAFPGGILWADMGTNRDHGERTTDVTPNDILTAVLRRWIAEMQPSYPIPPSLDALLGSVRALITVRLRQLGPCLAILDNVDTDDTLQPLTESLPECAILITTRKTQLASTYGMTRIDIGGFSRAASKDYFHHLLGASDKRLDGIDQIFDRVEDHPLAVRLLAHAMQLHPKLQLAEALRGLKPDQSPKANHQQRLILTHIPESLEACFRFSIEQLQASLHPFLIAVASQSSISWSIEAIDYTSGMCNISKSVGFTLALLDSGLIERVGDGRYRMHRLLRDYIRFACGRVHFGIIPGTWEIASLAWVLCRVAPHLSAGIIVYDTRQEYFFQQYLLNNRNDPKALKHEWDGIAAEMYRRIEANAQDATPKQLSLLAHALSGANLSGLHLGRVILDCADLKGANLDRVDLASDLLYARKTRWWDTLFQSGTRLVPQALLWSAILYLVFFQMIEESTPGPISSAIKFEFERPLVVVGVFALTLGGFPIGALMLADWFTKSVSTKWEWLASRSRDDCLVLERQVMCTITVLLYMIVITSLSILWPSAVSAEFFDYFKIARIWDLPKIPLLGWLLSIGTRGAIRFNDVIARSGMGGFGKRVARATDSLSLPVWLYIVYTLFAEQNREIRTNFPHGIDGWLVSHGIAYGLNWLSILRAARYYSTMLDARPRLRVLLTTLPVLGFIALLYFQMSSDNIELFGGCMVVVMLISILKDPLLYNVPLGITRSYLRKAVLKGATLRSAMLRGADLAGADLSWSDMSGADMEGARLSGANLKGANLSDTRLVRANLKGANLEGARVVGADFTDAQLENAHCENLVVGATTRWPKHFTIERAATGKVEKNDNKTS